MKIDTHLHTSYSKDCAVAPETVVATAMRRGLDALIVTDHNEVAGAYAVKAIAPFPVVIAEEIKTSEGEIIGLFIQERIARGLPPAVTARQVRDQGGLVCVPHPFDRLRGSRLAAPALDDLVAAGLVDIIEVFNSRTTLPADNARALAYARQHDLPTCAGSDAHSVMEYGMACTELAPFDGPGQYLANLRAATLHTRPSPFVVHVLSKWAKYGKKIGLIPCPAA
ncbi:MAG: PHP domain-containing protein [Chloroflexi bacterium]|nr:PHP domain-containing protein [Chloroflexota bacterium]